MPMKALSHFITITKHRHLVLKYCFRLGLYWQGLTHDLSKYSPTEFSVGAKYYQGNRSPNDMERMNTGMSLAWLHHKGRNRHHLEYWIDYNLDKNDPSPMSGMKMPYRYVAESFCDRLAAAKIYLKENYTDSAPYDFYLKSKGHILIHPDTASEMEKMLLMLKEEGEEAVFKYIRKQLLV